MDKGTQNDSPAPVDLGIYGRRLARDFSAAEWIATILTALWLIGALVFFGLMDGAAPAPSGGLNAAMVLIAVVLPVAVIWLAALAARSARIMRAESDRLQAALNTMRQSFLEAQQAHGLGPRALTVEKKLEEIAEAQRHTETALATFVSTRPALARAAPEAARVISPPDALPGDDSGQPSLALGTPAEAQAHPIDIDTLIRAINFPEHAEDHEGFAAVRQALADRRVAGLIQAAQDVLTLLSQDGIYMDDLRPDRARPEVWRRFAQGARGRAVAALGGIHDRSSLALTAGRMRHDTIFRDAAHHFLRRFDEAFSAFEPEASDAAIARLGDTRTARAFMLIGRVAGTFD